MYELHFGPGKPGRLLARDSAEDLVKIVHDCGGVVVYSPEGNFDQSVWNKLVDIKIDGVMAWHGSRLGKDRKGIDTNLNAIKSARKLGLLVLGGSDYDPRKQDWELGVGRGDLFINKRRLNEFKERLALIRSKG